jgi:hypothetical protein
MAWQNPYYIPRMFKSRYLGLISEDRSCGWDWVIFIIGFIGLLDSSLLID